MTLKFRKYLPRICTSSISECCAVICVDPEYVSRYFRLPSFPRSFSISIFLYIYILACNLSSKQGTKQECGGGQRFHLHTDRKNVVRRFVI